MCSVTSILSQTIVGSTSSNFPCCAVNQTKMIGSFCQLDIFFLITSLSILHQYRVFLLQTSRWTDYLIPILPSFFEFLRHLLEANTRKVEYLFYEKANQVQEHFDRYLQFH